jgi:SagB-type dehydrogenase family enzyme
MDIKKLIEKGRNFLKAPWDTLGEEVFSVEKTDQQKGVKQPPLENPIDNKNNLIDLVSVEDFDIEKIDYVKLLKKRRSRRAYKNETMSLKELSFLLWSTQGVEQVIRDGYATLRTVPSAGARHPFETYLYIRNVENIEKGIYRYSALYHKLIPVKKGNFDDEMFYATQKQKMTVTSAVTFIWSVVPYRTEWRYSFLSHKVIALDAGHVCQNLYLSAEILDYGTCAIGAYSQEKMDDLLGLDGNEEFSIYIAPVGKIK